MFCRLCLTTPKSGCYLIIFDTENLAQIIAQHFPFEPRKEDLQKVICDTCWDALEKFHQFYIQIEEAQKSKENSLLNLPEEIKFELKEEVAFDDPTTIHSNIKSEFEVNEENLNNCLRLRPKRKTSLQKINSKKKISKSKDVKSKTEMRKDQDEVDQKILSFTKLRCDICLKEEPTFTEIKKHFRSEHNMLGYVTCCEKKFSKRIYLADHIETHLNPEQFKCQICNRVQSNHNSLRQHIKVVHETPRNWECDICQKKMANRSALELHKYTHIPVEDRSFKCTDCSKTFASEYQMKTHWSKVHESLSNNICYVCGKIIKDPVLFKKHQLEHEGIFEPKAQCEKCGIWLKNVLSLRKHVRNLHTDENIDHICSLCNKLCPSQAALKSHKFYVHNTRTYPCTVCGKEFKKTITLKEHMSTHTGEILYTCPHCPKTFTSNANLHHHRKKSHRKEWEEKRASKLQPPVTNEEVDTVSTQL